MRRPLTFVAPLVLVAAGIAACSAAKRSGFEAETNSADAGVEGGLAFTDGQVPCAGLECKRVQCSGGTKTSLKGKVYDPAGSNPLYNVVVYIPSGPNGDADLPPIKEGMSCETCAGVAINPMVSALTDTNGEFVLEDVPVDQDVPVVVQIGKWRRKIKFNITKQCEENTVPDREFRLPKNSQEGDLPHIAVTAGSCDALECLLRGVGVDDSEFVAGGNMAGHVHMFKGSGGRFSGAPDAKTLWEDPTELAKYDIVMNNCECSENETNKSPQAHQATYEYLNAGGRMFGTHYHYTWFKNHPQDEFKQIAASYPGGYGPSQDTYNVNTTFPKGQALAEWLKVVGASTTVGQVPLKTVRASVEDLRQPATSWIEKPDAQGKVQSKFFSFNTPLANPPDQQCGRNVFSDLHITDAAGPAQISSCTIGSGGLNPQQKALEFMFFDLSSCIQDDKTPPVVPK